MIACGIPQDDAERALSATHGDVERAMHLLFIAKEEKEKRSAVINTPDHIQSPPAVNRLIAEISQYTFGTGASACTPICLIGAISCLEKLSQTPSPPLLSLDLISTILTEGVNVYQILNDSSNAIEHSSCDELLTNEIFSNKLATKELGIQGLLQSNNNSGSDMNSFLVNLENIRNQYCIGVDGDNVAIIITKPPETVLVIMKKEKQVIVNGDSDDDDTIINTSPSDNSNKNNDDNIITYLYDSHPRPSLSIFGASLTSYPTLNSLSDDLKEIFPRVELDGDGSGMTDMMYNCYDMSVLTLKTNNNTNTNNSINTTNAVSSVFNSFNK